MQRVYVCFLHSASLQQFVIKARCRPPALPLPFYGLAPQGFLTSQPSGVALDLYSLRARDIHLLYRPSTLFIADSQLQSLPSPCLLRSPHCLPSLLQSHQLSPLNFTRVPCYSWGSWKVSSRRILCRKHPSHPLWHMQTSSSQSLLS